MEEKKEAMSDDEKQEQCKGEDFTKSLVKVKKVKGPEMVNLDEHRHRVKSKIKIQHSSRIPQPKHHMNQELAPYDVMSDGGEKIKIMPTSPSISTRFSSRLKTGRPKKQKSERRGSLVVENSIINEMHAESSIPLETEVLQASEWKIQNVTFPDDKGETKPMPVVALTLSHDASKVAYGGIMSGKFAPVRVHDLKCNRMYEFKRKGLIASLGFLGPPPTSKTEPQEDEEYQSSPAGYCDSAELSDRVGKIVSKAEDDFSDGTAPSLQRKRGSTLQDDDSCCTLPNWVGKSLDFDTASAFRLVIADTVELSILDMPSGDTVFKTGNHKNIADMAILDYGNPDPMLPGAEKETSLLAVCSNESIFIYNPETFEQTGQIDRVSIIQCLAFTRSRDHILLAAGETNNTVSVFTVSLHDDPHTVMRISLSSRINSVFFSDLTTLDGRLNGTGDYQNEAINLLAVGDMDKTARIFTIESLVTVKDTRRRRTSAKEPMRDRAQNFKNKFRRKGKSTALVASANLDKEERGSLTDFWDWEEMFQVKRPDVVSKVAISRNGRVLAVADDSKEVAIYDVVTGAHIHNFPQKDRITAVLFCSEAAMLAVGGFDSYCTIYDMFYGLQLEDFVQESHTVIQSVSLSGDGSRLAISTRKGISKIFSLSEEGSEQIFEFTAKEGKSTWIVKISSDGKWLATGGYDNKVRVFDVEYFQRKNQHNIMWQFQTKFFIWGLELLKDELSPSATLAIGDWTGMVQIYNLRLENGLSVQDRPISIKMKDRIFSLSFAADGKTLAVGNRNCTATVWSLSGGEAKLQHNYDRTDRVYTVALNPDASLLAVGGVDKLLAIYDLSKDRLLKEFKRTALINFAVFTSDGSILGVVGDDRLCVLYDMSTMDILLQSTYESEVTSISFCTSNAMAIAAGSTACVYGKGKNNYGITARPSFMFASEFLEDTDALKILVKNHPTIVNCRDENTGDTLLHIAVSSGLLDALSILLQSECTIGLLSNKKNISAVQLAVDEGQKEMVKLLLRAILKKKISNLPGSLGEIMDIKENKRRSTLTKLGTIFPDLYLQFLSELKVEKSGPLVLGDLSDASLKSKIYVCANRRTPRQLWQTYLKYQKDEAKKKHTDEDDDAFRVAVECFRVPIKDFTNAVNFKDVIKYAELTQDLRVFNEDTIVTAIINYKQPIYMYMFKKQLAIYILFLITTLFWAYSMAYTRHDTWKQVIAGYTKVGCNWGPVSLALSPFVGVGCLWFIFKEVNQLRSEYTHNFKSSRSTRRVFALKRYIGSVWNVNDMLAFGFTLISLVMYFCRYVQMHQFASIAVIMLVLKLLYFARAFKSWSLVVRTLLQVILSIKYIAVVMFLVVMGFTCSYLVLIGADYREGDGPNYFRNPLVASLSTWLFVFGEYGSLQDHPLIEDWKDGGGLAVILLLILLIIVVLLLLNVVIAKMGDTYAEVRDRAVLESRLEVAKIIYELESISRKKFFPWLHSLQPLKSHLLEIPENREVQMINKMNVDFQNKFLDLARRVEDLSTTSKTQYESIMSEIQKLNEQRNERRRPSKVPS